MNELEVELLLLLWSVIEKNGKKGIRLCKVDFMCAAVTVRLV
jgi:hypothetical protein